MTNQLLGLLVSGALLWSPLAQAQASVPTARSTDATTTDDADRLNEMSLHDLLDVPIFTPTREKDSVHTTPAIISVVTAEEIEDMGATSLYEVLNTVPGIEVVEHFNGSYSVNFRGVIQVDASTRVLFMLNGHPLREFQSGAFFAESVPLSSIRQVEIIRGPGSVEYGASAFAGVINVITKAPDDSTANRAHVEYGSFHTRDVTASIGTQAKEVGAFIAVQHHQGDGFGYNTLGPDANADIGHNYNNFDSAYASVNWKDLTLQGNYFSDAKTRTGIIYPTQDRNGVLLRENGSLDLRYQHGFESVTLVGSVLYDSGRKRDNTGLVATPGLPPPQDLLVTGQLNSGHHLGAEVHSNWSVAKYAKLSGGLSFDSTTESAGADYGVPYDQHSESDAAAYAEAYVNPIQKLGLNVGARFDQNSRSGGLLLPRASAVYNLTDSLSVKALYGRAYRNPSLEERYNGAIGAESAGFDPAAPTNLLPPYILQPEKIDTFDLGADLKLNRTTLRINGYYLHTTDLIDLTRASAFENYPGLPLIIAPKFGNGPGFSSLGAEAEIKGYATESFLYFLNVSINHSYQDSFSNKLPFRPPVIANAGVSYTLPLKVRFKVATYATITGPRGGNLTDQRDTYAFPDPRQVEPAYVIWNANLTWSVSDNVDLSAIFHNLLNTRYAYAESVNPAGPVTPGAPFSASVRLSAHW